MFLQHLELIDNAPDTARGILEQRVELVVVMSPNDNASPIEAPRRR